MDNVVCASVRWPVDAVLRHLSFGARAGRCVIFAIAAFCGAMHCYAQETGPLDSTPPPAKVISKQERAQLDRESDVKDRTKLALELMDARIQKAQELHDTEQLDPMFAELGGFHALVDDTLVFLTGSDRDSGRVLNNFKRFEIGLRKFVPRLEVLRRDLPLRYEFYVRRLMIFLREARAKAIEPLFSDTVVPGKKP